MSAGPSNIPSPLSSNPPSHLPSAHRALVVTPPRPLPLIADKISIGQRDREEEVAEVVVGVMPLMLHPRNVLDPLPWDHQVIGGQRLPHV